MAPSLSLRPTLAFLLLVGCVGALDDGPGDSVRLVCEPSDASTSLAMRRMSRTQYRAAIDALFDGRVPPGDAWDELEPPVLTGFTTEFGTVDIGEQELEHALDAAEEVALSVHDALGDLLPCASSAPGRACAEEFARRYARRAYRRPPTDAELAALLGTFDAVTGEGASFAEAVAALTAHLLSAPQFLYVVEDAAPVRRTLTGSELVTRMSFLLRDAPPDDVLLDRAETFDTSSREAVRALATELLDDPRSDAALARFAVEWTGASRVSPADRPPADYPGFDASISGELSESFARTTTSAIRGEATLRELFATTPIVLDGPLATFLGAPDRGADWHDETELPGGAGLLAHPALLAALSHSDGPSYVFRGRLFRKRLLCAELGSPPQNALMVAGSVEAALPPNPTARDHSEAIRNLPACARCHDLMDPAGLAFEPFDAVGRWRTMDGSGRPFEVSDALPDVDGATLGFVDHRELIESVADAQAVQRCFARQFVRFAFSRPEVPRDVCALDGVREAIETGSIRDGVLAFVVSETFLHREAP